MSNNSRSGFTLVELMLSISFIAILLLAIAMLIIQMSAIYNKGLTLREANQAGQFISSEIQRSLNQTYSNAVEAVEFSDGHGTYGGRLCAGGTVYAWNYPSSFSDTHAINRVGTSADASDVRFVKFSGTADKYCQQNEDTWEQLPYNATELLSEGNANIAIHSFSLERSVVNEDNSQTIYTVKMVVGTTNVGLVTDANGTRCNDGNKKDDEWCAVNEFGFTARSGNREVLQ